MTETALKKRKVEKQWVLDLLRGRGMTEKLQQLVANAFVGIEEDGLASRSLQEVMSLLPAAIEGAERVNAAMSLQDGLRQSAPGLETSHLLVLFRVSFISCIPLRSFPRQA